MGHDGHLKYSPALDWQPNQYSAGCLQTTAVIVIIVSIVVTIIIIIIVRIQIIIIFTVVALITSGTGCRIASVHFCLVG